MKILLLCLLLLLAASVVKSAVEYDGPFKCDPDEYLSDLEWILTLKTPTGITVAQSSIIQQGGTTGILKTELQNQWTLTADPSLGITENVGVAVSQGDNVGTLGTKLQNAWTIAIASTTISVNTVLTQVRTVYSLPHSFFSLCRSNCLILTLFFPHFHPSLIDLSLFLNRMLSDYGHLK